MQVQNELWAFQSQRRVTVENTERKRVESHELKTRAGRQAAVAELGQQALFLGKPLDDLMSGQLLAQISRVDAAKFAELDRKRSTPANRCRLEKEGFVGRQQ